MMRLTERELALATELRHEIHRNPDLSHQERPTMERVMAFLRQHTDLEICDRGEWLYAVYRSGSDAPGIAFRCELDALPIEDGIDAPYRSVKPGVGHKCGHDGHAATLCALAMALQRLRPAVDVYLLFQHAEEVGDGGAPCTALVRENPIAAIYAWHNHPGTPFGTALVREGTIYCGSKGLTFTFLGTPTHAAHPEQGRCPAQAVAELVQAIPELIRPDLWQKLVLCTVIQMDVGEPNFGTQAYRGCLRLTIRGELQREQDFLEASLHALAKTLAERDGLQLTVEECDAFPATVNDADCTARVRQVCAKLGIPVQEIPRPYRASDDYGHLTAAVPGVIFELGGGEACPDIHTEAFDFPDGLMSRAVEVLLALTEEHGGAR